jgi:integrase
MLTSSSSGQLDPKPDPSRRCLKLEHWPAADRRAWEEAVTPGGLLDEAGLAAHWRPATLKSVQDAYWRWLTFLTRQGYLDPEAGPAERLTPDRLRAFIAELQATVAPLTVRNRVRDLTEALRVMAPETDFSYLSRARARLKARSRLVRNKRAQVRSSRDLVGLGLELMRKAERGEAARPLWRAALFRDGLMILMLACRPLRRASFAGLQLGRHLVRRGEVYVLLLEEHETKNHRRFEQPLPRALTPLIERYLDHYRPRLLGSGLEEATVEMMEREDHLWISWRGEPLAETGIYACIVARTRAAFGTAIPPHRLRDSAVTSLGETDPELVRLAPTLLHHADQRIAEMHYNQARDGQAVALWQDYVRAERQKARRSAQSGNARDGRGSTLKTTSR